MGPYVLVTCLALGCTRHTLRLASSDPAYTCPTHRATPPEWVRAGEPERREIYTVRGMRSTPVLSPNGTLPDQEATLPFAN